MSMGGGRKGGGSESCCLQCREVSMQQRQSLRYRWNHRGATGVIHCHCRCSNSQSASIPPHSPGKPRRTKGGGASLSRPFSRYASIGLFFFSCRPSKALTLLPLWLLSSCLLHSNSAQQEHFCLHNQRRQISSHTSEVDTFLFPHTCCGQMVCFLIYFNNTVASLSDLALVI